MQHFVEVYWREFEILLKKESRQVLTLTKEGKRLIRRHGFALDDQAIYSGFVKPKEADHDATLYRLPSHFPPVLHAALQSAATAEERRHEMSLLTVYEVAERLQVPVSWVYQRTRRHGPEQLPHFKIGKYLRFEEHALLDFIQRQRCA